MQIHGQSFQAECRKWRQFRKLSQLDLALNADISQRHLSYLETGRSLPSREMIIRLCEAMEIPLRERNALLASAGYSAIYSETNLDEPAMVPVLEALNRMLAFHDPFPAIVIDRFWNVKRMNQSASALFALISSEIGMNEGASAEQEVNMAELSLHPNGLRKVIRNWRPAAAEFVQRLRSEASASGNQELKQRFARYIELAEIPESHGRAHHSLLPVLPLEFSLQGMELGMFSVISTFGTPQDITTDELRIEAFYPVDRTTEAFFRQLIQKSEQS